MLISSEDAIKRLSSPMNLMNRMNGNGSRSKAMSLFVPSIPTKINNDLPKEEPTKLVSFNPFQQTETVTSVPVPSLTPSIARPEQVTTVDKLIDNHDTQIKLALAHDSALDVLTSSISTLKSKLDDMKPEKLAGVITATSKVVESIRKERNEAAKNGKDREVHYHFYTPQQKKIDDYAVIDV